ncbi:MAG: CotH kinase family protein [Bacteroidales bacterium]|nr:CotH kinase family protein [Bacteroidales bacterium]
MSIRSSIPLFLAAALLVACHPDEVVEEAARLRSVSVTETALVLPEGGQALLHFKVQDPGYPLDLRVGDSRGSVSLTLFDGSAPQYVRLTEVRADGAAGSYIATLQDRGDNDFQEDVYLRVRSSEGSVVTAPRVAVQGSAFQEQEQLLVDTGLPVVIVDTQGGRAVNSKETFVPGTVRIQGVGSWDGLAETGCEIRGRGNTTWTWPKKPYLLKLTEKQHVFGMHKHKRWVLLANFMDRTLMRNLVSMKVASMMSNLAWTPGCVPVELVLNGRHMGSYLLIEQVRVDNHRVAITEMTPEDNTGDAVTGGYLLELDFHYDNPVQWTDPHGHNNQWGNGIPFGVKYPDPDEITPQQVNYIKGYISEAANTLYGNDFKDPDKGYAKYIDVDSFIDYWIVFEVMGNHELGNPGSVFMHKDRGGKLVAGPCWDFDWGVLSYNTSPQARTGLVNGSAIWYGRLRQDPAFEAKLKARFNELLPQLETIPDYMDECEKLLKASAGLNFAMWNPAEDASQNGGRIINGDENMSFHDAVARLKAIYKERLKVIPTKL